MKISPASLKTAIVGATGVVGRELLLLLKSREFPVSDLLLFASKKNENQFIKFGGQNIRCQALKPACFDGADFVFFDASDELSREWVPEALRAGAWVIDSSAAHRLDPEIILSVPEVNGSLLDEYVKTVQANGGKKLVAGPNCTTVQLVVALQALHSLSPLKRVVVSTYQSVSGAGSSAIEELSLQTVGMMQEREPEPRVFKHRIAFNCIPQIGGFDENGDSGEERKVVDESRKILGIPSLKMSVTAVRVPTFSCHAESVNVELEKPITALEAREQWSKSRAIELLDEPSTAVYPMNINQVGKDTVGIGRIRKDESVENGLNFWVVSDNLRKGAALNAIQIAERINENRSD